MTERPSAHAVEFVDVASMAKWIQKDGVGNIIAGMVDFLEEDFKKWQSFDKIPRVASHTPFGVISADRLRQHHLLLQVRERPPVEPSTRLPDRDRVRSAR